VPGYRQDLAAIFRELACLLRDRGQLPEAERLFRQAIPLQEQLVADFPDVLDYQHHAAVSLADFGKLLRQRGELTEARHLLEKAISRAQAALRPNPLQPDYRQSLGDDYRELAEALVQMGNHAEAAKAVDEAERLAPSRWQKHEHAGRLLARCAPLAEKDDRLPETQRRALAQQYAGRAVALLTAAVAKGYQDANALRKEAVFEPLRGRADFQALLRKLEEKARHD
jgi:tetratricopeptide (TPR) repeat protein